MAISVKYDINQGGLNASLGTNGKDFNIVHGIYNVDDGLAFGAGNKMDWVLDYFVAILGFTIGSDIDPVYGVGSWLRNIKVRPAGGGSTPNKNDFIVTLIYRTNPRQEIKIDSTTSLSQISTNVDIDGDPVELTYVYGPDFPPDDETLQGKTVTQGGLFDKLVPEQGVIFRFREEVDPAAEAETYVGKVNSEVWRGGQPGEWMCVSINGYSDDSGTFFDNAYAFQKRRGNVLEGHPNNGWDPYLVFIDKSSGKPPPGVKDTAQSAATATPRVYDEIDFNFLFSFPS